MIYLLLSESRSNIISNESGFAVNDVFVQEDEDLIGERDESGRLAFLRNQESDTGVTAVAFIARLRIFRTIGCGFVCRFFFRRKESVRKPFSEDGFAVFVFFIFLVVVDL